MTSSQGYSIQAHLKKHTALMPDCVQLLFMLELPTTTAPDCIRQFGHTTIRCMKNKQSVYRSQGIQFKDSWNNYFEPKHSWVCCPNSNYLLSSIASQDTATCQNNATTYRNYEHTQFHSGMGTQTVQSYIFLSLNPSSFGVVPNNLASNVRYTA